jgi:hypothetical protein
MVDAAPQRGDRVDVLTMLSDSATLYRVRLRTVFVASRRRGEGHINLTNGKSVRCPSDLRP